MNAPEIETGPAETAESGGMKEKLYPLFINGTAQMVNETVYLAFRRMHHDLHGTDIPTRRGLVV